MDTHVYVVEVLEPETPPLPQESVAQEVVGLMCWVPATLPYHAWML